MAKKNKRLILNSKSSGETQTIGKKIGRLLSAGAVISLEGPLGSGKTCLAQGIAEGLEVKDYVTSPSFILAHEYQGRLPVYHIDVYRITDIDEMFEMGYEDYLYSQSVTIIEWGDKISEILPEEHLKIKLRQLNEEREIHLIAFGERYKRLLKELRK